MKPFHERFESYPEDVEILSGVTRKVSYRIFNRIRCRHSLEPKDVVNHLHLARHYNSTVQVLEETIKRILAARRPN